VSEGPAAERASRRHLSRPGRPRVIYISYDGLGEPLGRSQVLGYISRLAAEYDITLISFEKRESVRARLRSELAMLGISWIPLTYHRKPPVLSTVLDSVAGVRALIRASRGERPAIVHVRSYVPALIALLGSRWTGAKLLFDIRGFWVDERVEGGIWPATGLLYRIAKRCERWFFAEADAIVTLTEASVPQIRAWTKGRDVEIAVIPTCVDLDRFADRPPRPDGPHALWSGSIGTWYRFDLTAPVARALAMPLTVITRQTELARELLAGYPAEVRTVTPDRVPDELFAGDIGLSLIKSSFSKIASAPTRFAEYLAAGMPVLVTPEVGDLESIVNQHRVGVVLRGEDEDAVADGARRVAELARDHETRDRCRRLAGERFDVDTGSRRYAEIYERLIGAS
jgi:glycosyltransferase involved in cell wall biosynthesis